MSVCPKCGGELPFKLSYLFKWSWWNAKVHPIPMHCTDDWMAPRYYTYIFMPIIYLIMIGCIVWVCVDCYKQAHKAPQQIEAPLER